MPQSIRWAAGLGCLLLSLSACSSSTSDSSTAASTSTSTSTSTSAPSPSLAVVVDTAPFLAEPSAAGAGDLAEQMIRSGDRRWVPWLLDLHRVAVSNLVDITVAEGLAELSGIERPGSRLTDFQVYGQWAQTEEIDPGPGYRAWKIALYERVDDEYRTLLDQIPDDLLLSQTHWGGVPRGGIPELNNQERVPASEADWMVDDEVVFGVEINGQSVAYPVRILGHHELANDVVGGTPIALVYCTLCKTALLFDSSVDGQVLEFETSGLLWSSNKVMVDRQTDTLWQHLSGEAIGGELLGQRLTQLPVITTTWREWLAGHPDTETLTLPGTRFFPDIPDRPPLRYDYSPGAAYAEYYENESVWFPILETSDALPLKAEIIGLSDGDHHLAVPLADLVRAGRQTIAVGGASFTLEPTSVGVQAFDASGEAVAVPQSFWFAWYGQHPDTEIWQAP